MKLFSEKNYHALFKIGIIIKAVDSVIEIAAGLLFAFLSNAAINQIVLFFVQNEVTETPRDFFWTVLAKIFQGFVTTSKSYWAILFLAHGIMKIFLIVGLLRKKAWAYPISALIFATFALSQIYQMAHNPSFAVALITVFDLILIVLILHEYEHFKKSGRARVR
jgi:uncharacterized membrane protein